MGAIWGTSKEKLYQELGFSSLKDRRWLRRLCYLYKIVNTKKSSYLYDLIPPFQRSSRNKGCIYEPFCGIVSFKNSFLPYAIKEWNKLRSEIRSTETYVFFRKMLLNFIRPIGNSTDKIYDPLGIKLLTRSRLGLAISPNTNLDTILLTHWIRFVLALWKVYISFFSTLPKLYILCRALMSDLENINDAIVFEWKWPTSCYTVRKQELWQ